MKLAEENSLFTTIATNLAIMSMCHEMLFSALSLKQNIFFGADIAVKIQSNVV